MLHSNPSQKIKVGWRRTPFTFIAHAGLPPGYSHTCQTPWSVFLDGSVAPVASATTPRPTEPALAGALRWPCDGRRGDDDPLVNINTEPDATGREVPNGCRPRAESQSTPGANGFPLADFKHSLTLFSKFFASFPHGTCSLSVMSQYLALEGIYLPLSPPVPR